MNRTEALAILYEALGEPIGLLLAAEPAEQVRQRLYAARAASGDPDLNVLQIRRSPLAEGTLVIVKGCTLAPRSGT